MRTVADRHRRAPPSEILNTPLLQINPDDHAEDSTVLHVQERLFVPAHSEMSKFNNSASSHRLQTCLWPLTVPLLYHNIHYTRELCHFSLYKSHTSNIVMSVTSSTPHP